MGFAIVCSESSSEREALHALFLERGWNDKVVSNFEAVERAAAEKSPEMIVLRFGTKPQPQFKRALTDLGKLGKRYEAVVLLLLEEEHSKYIELAMKSGVQFVVCDPYRPEKIVFYIDWVGRSRAAITENIERQAKKRADTCVEAHYTFSAAKRKTGPSIKELIKTIKGSSELVVCEAATAEEIAEVEEHLGYRFPADVRAFYKACNGLSAANNEDLWIVSPLLDLASVNTEGSPPCWIAISDLLDGNCVAIDLEAGEIGAPVLDCFHELLADESPQIAVVARSFTEYLWLATTSGHQYWLQKKFKAFGTAKLRG